MDIVEERKHLQESLQNREDCMCQVTSFCDTKKSWFQNKHYSTQFLVMQIKRNIDRLNTIQIIWKKEFLLLSQAHSGWSTTQGVNKMNYKGVESKVFESITNNVSCFTEEVQHLSLARKIQMRVRFIHGLVNQEWWENKTRVRAHTHTCTH